MTIQVFSNADIVAGELTASAWKARSRSANVLRVYSNYMLREIRALAPFKTGEYRNSIGVQWDQSGPYAGFEIGTDLDRGYSLEFGGTFTTPSGQTARRPPRPHFRPVMAMVEPRIGKDIATAVAYP